jgi:hypothetical protein
MIMGAINEIFRTFGPEYIDRFPEMPAQHKKVVHAIIDCRSGELGATVYQCVGCGETHQIDRSCGDRHCPQCQLHKCRLWLQTQLDRILPTDYFMLTFTMPEQIRPFCRANQKVAYAAMFKAASGAIRKLAMDPRHIGTDLPGFSGILHTWGRTMPYHPHLHFIVPAGGLSKNRQEWIPAGNTFYLPVRPLSKIFRAKFKDEIRKKGLLNETDPQAWRTDWVVHCKPAGNAEAVLKYLAPYVFRVAISNKRILAVRDRKVTFSFRKVGCNRERQITVDALEFIRRFLQHVLPAGFMKVRHYGFMNPNCAVSVEAIRRMVIVKLKKLALLLADPPEKPARENFQPFCKSCGAMIVFLFSIIPATTCREGPG